MKYKLLIIFLLLIITGCVTNLKNIPDNYSLEEDKSVVFGEILPPVGGFDYEDGNLIFIEGGDLTFKNLENDKIYNVAPSQEGNRYHFFVLLPRGKYEIRMVRWGNFFRAPGYNFVVPSEKILIYAGTIRIDFVKRFKGPLIFNGLGFSKKIVMETSLTDNYKEAINFYRDRFSNFDLNDAKNFFKRSE